MPFLFGGVNSFLEKQSFLKIDDVLVIFRSDLIICLFSSTRPISSRPKLAIFRPLMIVGASPLGLSKGFALRPYQGALAPHGPLH